MRSDLEADRISPLSRRRKPVNGYAVNRIVSIDAQADASQKCAGWAHGTSCHEAADDPWLATSGSFVLQA